MKHGKAVLGLPLSKNKTSLKSISENVGYADTTVPLFIIFSPSGTPKVSKAIKEFLRCEPDAPRFRDVTGKNLRSQFKPDLHNTETIENKNDKDQTEP